MGKIMNFFEKHGVKMSQILIIVIGFMVIAMAGLVWFFKVEDNDLLSGDVLAKVGDKRITQEDLNNQIYSRTFTYSDEVLNNATQEEKDRYLQELIEAAIAELEAKELGITVSEEEITNHIQAELGKQYEYYTDEEKAITKDAVRSMFLLQKVKDSQIGWREGNYLAFNFHKYLEDEGYQTAGQGDENLISAQKRAAKDLADKVSEGLKNKTMTLDQAKQLLINDPNIGNAAMLPRTPVMFASFDREKFLSNAAPFDTESVSNSVLSLGKDETSQTVADTAKFGDQMTEYRYLVFVITDASGGKYKNYQDWFEAMKVKYGITTKTSLAEKAVSLIREKLTGTAEASLPNLTTLKACNKCNRDNANLAFYTRILRASGTYEPLDFKADTTIITGGASTDPAIAPNGTSTSCPNRVFEVRTGTTEYGLISLCHLSKSFYCSTASAAAYYVPRYVNTTNAANSMLEQTYPTHPSTEWRWYYRDAVYPDFTFNGTNPDVTQVRIRLSLNAADNGGTTRNGDTVQNGLTWRPVYKRTLTITPNGNGTGTIESSPNWLGNNISINCPATTPNDCTTSTPTSRDYELLYQNARTVDIIATPLEGGTVEFSNNCAVRDGAVSGQKICTVLMDINRSVSVTFYPSGTTGDNLVSTCEATPESGLSPLTIKAKATLVAPPTGWAGPYSFGFRFDGERDTLGTFFQANPLGTQTSGDIYYTYRTAGTYELYYKIKATGGETDWALCSPPNIYVDAPSSPGGGEVAP